MQKPEVTLRPWSENDLNVVMRFMTDPEMTEHLGGPESSEKVQKRHELYLRMNDEDKGRMYVIVAGPDNAPVGSIGYWERELEDQTVWETGWNVFPEHQGHNYATLATLALIEKMREAHKHRYVYAYPDVDNGASNAICKKAGFTLESKSEYEFPKGHFMMCNNWRFDLYTDA